MKHYDCHVHFDINHRFTPPKVFAMRTTWHTKKIEKLIRYYKKFPYIVKIILTIYNFFRRDINIDRFLKYYLVEDPKFKIMNELKKNGIDRAIGLHIDFKNHLNKLSDIQKNNMAFHQITCEKNIIPIAGYSDTSKNPLAINDCKVYPALLKDYSELRLIQYDLHFKTFYVHCSTGGIGRNTELNDPALWYDVLNDRPGIKIVFCHGGALNIAYQKTIKHFMREFETLECRPRVFVDTAFNDLSISNPKKYFKYLKKLIAMYPNNVLFGSDFPLHTVLYSYQKLIKTYKKYLSSYEWNLITYFNPDDLLEPFKESEIMRIAA